MQIDILSDTHFDSWLGYPHRDEPKKLYPHHEAVISLWRRFKPKADYLVLAGDIGHSIAQNIHILKILKESFYKEILLTLGNHDYYVAEREYKTLYQNGIEKATHAKQLYQEAGMIVLDGSVVEIEGVKFGGAMGWYHSAYAKKNKAKLGAMQASYHYPSLEGFLQELWADCINDKRYTRLDFFVELFDEEYAKLKAVHQQCDVMVSHYNPSSAFEHQTKQWARNPSTSFFCFNGEELVKNMHGNLWIYGHTHDSMRYTLHGKECLTNALGYYNEWPKPNTVISKEIIIEKK